MENLPINFVEETKEKFVVKKVDTFDDLIYEDIGDSLLLGMGESVFIKKDENNVVCSFGANPCLIIVSQLNNGEHIVFHSTGDQFTEKEEYIIKHSKRGICGGGLNSLNKYENFLKENNIKTIKSQNSKDDFNVVVVNEIKNKKSKQSIYYYYGDHLND